MKELSHQDCVDLCFGAAVLGTGGGGSRELGLAILERSLAMGKAIHLVSADAIGDDALVVTPSFVGSIAPGDNELRVSRALDECLLAPDGPLLAGLRLLEGHLGRRVTAVLAVEMGGLNTPLAGVLAAGAGVPLVDGDTVGRAKPELEIGSYSLQGMGLAPMALCDPWGNRMLVQQTADNRSAERIARALAVLGGCTVTVRSPMSGDEMRRMVVGGTVSKAISIGGAARHAVARGQDPVEAVIRASDGVRLFEGVVSRLVLEDRDGFLWAEYRLAGSGRHQGHELRMWAKNENEISWLDEQPFVTTPDLLCAIETDTGQPVVNTRLREGLHMTVFGVPSHPMWRTPEGLALAGPAHFGFSIAYRPLEELVSPRPR
jgi:hypothetical protein